MFRWIEEWKGLELCGTQTLAGQRELSGVASIIGRRTFKYNTSTETGILIESIQSSQSQFTAHPA